MEEYKYRVQFICHDTAMEAGYYQLVRISDDAILAAKQSYRAMVYELYERRIAEVTIWE